MLSSLCRQVHQVAPTKLMVAYKGLPGVRTAVRHAVLRNVQRGMCSGEKTYDVVVFGGNGFVGSNVCRILAEMGKKVAAINRSGAPRVKESWMDSVDYIAGDVFTPDAWRPVLQEAGGVIASIGAFGNYETMKRLNGDSNIVVAEEAAGAGVPRMVFVSASFPPFPASVPLRGYIEGKEAAEAVVRDRFPDTHVILKPSVIFGKQENAHPLIAAIRALGPVQEPLMTNTPLKNLSTLPVVGGVFLPWSPVEAVARAAAEGALGPLSKLTLLPDDIAKFKK